MLNQLYQVISQRKKEPQEGSYTCYLFDQGVDKILKKIGEETAETIIAAKNDDHEEISNEVCDLLYHLTVLLVEKGIPMEQVDVILAERSAKIGNLKTMKQTDKNT